MSSRSQAEFGRGHVDPREKTLTVALAQHLPAGWSLLPTRILVSAALYTAMLRMRTLPPGFIEPCLPTKADTLPSGGLWLHEIKHDGFRIIARKNGAQARLYSRPGN